MFKLLKNLDIVGVEVELSVVHSVVGSNQRLTSDPASGQDISIVPVSSAAPHKSVVGEFNSKSDQR